MSPTYPERALATLLFMTTTTTSGSPLTDVRELGTVLGIWAHPDDEAFLSAGLMAMARAAGQRVSCVTATWGERGTPDPESWPPARLAQVRAAEVRASLAVLDVREHHHLGVMDGTCADQPFDGMVDRLAAIVEAVRPDTVVTFGPDGMTGHEDHQTVSAWTTAAWREAAPTARLLYARGKDELMIEVIVHDPLLPEHIGRVEIKRPLRPQTCTSGGARRRGGIERLPPGARQVSLDPAMCVRGSHHVPSGHRVKHPALKTRDHAGGYVHGPQHHRHRGGKVFAMSFPAFE